MTTTASGRKLTSACNGVTVEFACPRFAQPADLKVYLLDSATEANADGTLLSAAVDYVLSGDGPSGTAKVTTTVAYPNGKFIRRWRDTSRGQGVAFKTGEAVPAATQEGALDRLSLVDEEHDDDFSRAISTPAGEAGQVLPSRAALASKFLVGDADGNLIPATGNGNDPDFRADLAAPGGANLSGFLPSGAGAVPRTVQAKLRDSVSVLDFGAKGNGIRNKTGSTVAANTNLTDASGTFTAADVGKSILIFGGSGVQTNLLTTIAAVASPTSITLSAPPTVTMTGNVIYCYGHDDTAAFVAQAAAYQASGVPAVIPDTGFAYLVMADQINYAPPSQDNWLYIEPPAIKADPTAKIMALSGGTYLVKLGTIAPDFLGLLRGGTYSLPIIDANNLAFAQAPLYLPFFLDIYLECEILNAAPAYCKLGDVAAPQASAGLKGKRQYTRQFDLFRRDSAAITNGVNPIVTFASPHGLWPSAGKRCVGISLAGAPVGWNPIADTVLDIVILSATQIQLMNVDSTGYGAFAGTASCYLNFASSAVSKKITGVTNANPCAITTAAPHLFTTGQSVDISEIGGMPNLVGQYAVTVTSPTAFTIAVNTTNVAAWGAYSGGNGPGWAMPWTPLAQCDIGEFCANAGDIDTRDMYCRHVRIGHYADPAHAGWDGKHHASHFYNFPEAGELLCAYYIGGNNSMSQVQIDGPFRYCFWTFGSNNFSAGCSTNYGGVGIQNDIYGTLVRTEAGASWTSVGDGLKGRGAARMFRDHWGLGAFACRHNSYNTVYSPMVEAGSGQRAAALVYDNNGATVSNFQGAATGGRTPGGAAAGDRFVAFISPVPLGCYVEAFAAGAPGIGAGAAAVTVEEDAAWAVRSVFQRRIITRVGGVPTDINLTSLTWRFP